MKKLLKKLLQKIESIEITYDYEETYNNLYDACANFGNDSGCWEFDTLFEDYYSYDVVEEIVKHELETGGLYRLKYFLAGSELRNEIFRINAYGNLEDIHKDDLDFLKEEIIDKIKELLENEENNK